MIDIVYLFAHVAAVPG